MVALHDDHQGESQQKSKLQWQEAEFDDSLTQLTATMHGIMSEDSETNAQLGVLQLPS